MTADERLDAAFAAAASTVSAMETPLADDADLAGRIARALDRRIGMGRMAIHGDRLPVDRPPGVTAPAAITVDIGVRGRFAGRLHAVARVMGADGDRDPVPALLAVAAAMTQRVWSGYLVVAAPGDDWRTSWAAPLADGHRATATLLHGRRPGPDLRGLRVPSRLGTRLVANVPLPAAGPGWTLRVIAVVVDEDGAEITL